MLKKIGFGLVAGVVATAVMDTSQTTLIPAVSSWIAALRGQPPAGESSDGSSQESPPESSPEKVAHRLADLLGISLNRQEVATWGNRVHWVYGAHWGSVYSTLGLPRSPLAGLGFGALLWLGSDELLLWALGIAGKPTDYPFSVHASALAAHLIYGSVVATMLAGLESAWPNH
ncbi:MAG TPA: hypothetical protein VHA53_10995 [Nitrolancea sp.]|nr:hypothetical protein [Nitrolancea sp.]